MEEFLNDIKGREAVDTVKVGSGFAILFDNGNILTVTNPLSVTFTSGEGWSELWDELKLNENS